MMITKGDLIMSTRCEICKNAQKQRGKALSRIRIMESQYNDNKLIMYILETIKNDLKGEEENADY